MGFVSYESYMQKALSGPGMTMDKLLCVGDIVDARVIEDAISDMPPVHSGTDCVQFGEAYSFARGDNGTAKPTYITFAFEDNDWVFKGACFEQTLENKCNLFGKADPSVGKYCVDKFYSEYVRAADKFLVDDARGVNVDKSSVIGDYMQFNVFTTAGYWLDAHGDGALEAFREALKDKQGDKACALVESLIMQRNEPLSSIGLNKASREQKQGVSNVNDLIANARVRSEVFNGVSDEREINEMDM